MINASTSKYVGLYLKIVPIIESCHKLDYFELVLTKHFDHLFIPPLPLEFWSFVVFRVFTFVRLAAAFFE